jgi:hypothetical protein
MESLFSQKNLALAALVGVTMTVMPAEAKLNHFGISQPQAENIPSLPLNKRPVPRQELPPQDAHIQILLITPSLLGAKENKMAIRYVKDFEFPAEAGYTKSATPVKGQMFAKGGDVKSPSKKADHKPHGIMIVIAEGKKPAHKSKGGIQYDDGGPDTSVPVRDVKSGKVKQSWDGQYDSEVAQSKAMKKAHGGEVSKNKDIAGKMNRKPVTAKKDHLGLKKGGQADAEDMGLYEDGKPASRVPGGPYVDQSSTTPRQSGPSASDRRALKALIDSSASDTDGDGYARGGKAKNWIQGAIKHPGALHKALGVKQGEKIPAAKLEKATHSKNKLLAKRAHLAETLKGLHKARGGKVDHKVDHWEGSAKDESQDKKLAKKHHMTMEAWEKSDMDKKHDAQHSMKGLRKGGEAKYADGGMATPMQRAPLARPSLTRAAMNRGVPAANMAPMVQGAAPVMAGVGQNRPGMRPNVGAIRSALARVASQATPANAPTNMKRGGKMSSKAKSSKC